MEAAIDVMHVFCCCYIAAPAIDVMHVKPTITNLHVQYVQYVQKVCLRTNMLNISNNFKNNCAAIIANIQQFQSNCKTIVANIQQIQNNCKTIV